MNRTVMGKPKKVIVMVIPGRVSSLGQLGECNEEKKKGPMGVE